MDIAYPHIAERVFGRAHPIEPAAFRAIVESPLARKILAGESEQAKKGKGRAKTARDVRREALASLTEGEWVRQSGGMVEYFVTRDGVAIVPVVGVLSARFDWLAALCGWTTYEGLSATFDAIADDYRVKASLMDAESVGGEAAGMLDCADKIIAARKMKPVWAVANAYAYSAAYGVVGSAETLFVPRLCKVGSIGAMCVHVDQSGADKEMGFRYTAIYSGERKIDGWAHAPLSDDARTALQSGVDYCRDQFAELVGRQGRMSKAEALATEADVFHDQPAVDAKLADRVGSFEQALQELTERVAERPRGTSNTAARAANSGEQAMADKPAEQATDPKAPPAAGATTDKPATDPKATPPAAASEAPKEKADKCPDCGRNYEPDKKEDAAQASVAGSILDLCAVAGASAEDARKMIAAKMSVAQVREALTAKAAAASDAARIDTTKDVTAANGPSWDKVIAKLPGQPA